MTSGKTTKRDKLEDARVFKTAIQEAEGSGESELTLGETA